MLLATAVVAMAVGTGASAADTAGGEQEQPGGQVLEQLLASQRQVLAHLEVLSTIQAGIGGGRGDPPAVFSAAGARGAATAASLEGALANQRLVEHGLLLQAKSFARSVRLDLGGVDDLGAATARLTAVLLADKERRAKQEGAASAAKEAAAEAAKAAAQRAATLRAADAGLAPRERVAAARARGDFADKAGAELHGAAIFGREAEVAKLLVPSYDGDADPDFRAWAGHTASYAAASRGNINELRLLAAAGADLSLAAEDGTNPCLVAVQAASTYKEDAGTLAVIALLAEHGVCSSADTEHGTTPAWDAAFNGRLDILKLLAKHGARLDVADIKNKLTPREAARSRHRDAVVAFLGSSGRQEL